MSPLDWLEKRIRPIAIPHLTRIIIAGQVACFLTAKVNPQAAFRAALIPRLVLDGEYWRVFSFPFHSFAENPFWFLIGMWALHFIGSTLEALWGPARYNLYLLIGYLTTVGAGFIYPDQLVSNMFIMTSIFLAFAVYFPDIQFRIFLIVPVKAKWCAAVTLAILSLSFITGDAQTRVSIAAGMSNFLLFFGGTMIQRMRQTQRMTQDKALRHRDSQRAFHECTMCGRTEKTNPDLEFRYCSQCAENPCYCEDHIGEHPHVTETA
jgi:hypothetical protein